jgi:nucleoside-diphosphate-sugar epimerase
MPVTIRDLVATVEQATGREVKAEWGARSSREREMAEDWRFGISPTGWTASTSLVDGLRRTWAS